MKGLRQNFDYKWVILVLCFLTLFVSLGFCSTNKGMFLDAMAKAFKVDRSVFSINDTLRYAATALLNFFFGPIILKYGVRKTVAAGFALLTLSSLSFALATNVWGAYIGGALLGFGFAFTSTAMVGLIIRRWFTANVGKYTGIAFAANGLGGALAAQIISPIINSGPTGYKKAYYLVAAVVFFTGVILLVFLKERPADRAETPDDTKKKKKGTAWKGIEFSVVKRRAFFYLTAATVFFSGFSLQGVHGVYIAYLGDIGFTPGFVAVLASVSSLSIFGSKLLVGAFYDRFGLRTVLAFCQGMAVLTYIIGVIVKPGGTGNVLAVLFVVCYALAVPIETLVIPLLTNDLFGDASFNKALGILISLNYTGYACGAPAVNLSYDLLGSYKPVFVILGVVMAIVFVVAQIVVKKSNKEKAAMLAAQDGQ